MERRNFIRNSCAACLSAVSLPVVLAGCRSLFNTTGTLTNDGLKLTTEDFLIKEKGSNAYKSFVIIRNDALQYPICIFRFNEEQYSALWMKCTHQGAELQASGEYINCPAHGSEFNNKGHVTSGPASTNLRTFPVTVNGKDIFIDLRKQ